jgi:transmembrane sensor
VKNNSYSVEDLLSDREFVEWVNNPTQESNMYWENLISNHPEKETFLKAQKIVSSIKFKEANNDPQLFNRSLNNILNNRFSASYYEVQEKSRKNRKLITYQIFKAAAVLLLIASLGAVIWSIQKSPENILTVAEVQKITKQNPKGQKTSFFLPDSTRVTLNSESSIRFLGDFKNDRTVELSGEAYFEVAHISYSEFTVKTGAVQTVVLGTVFNVRAFEDEDVVSVSLYNGKVMVEDVLDESADKLMLMPGEKFVYDKTSGGRNKTSFDRNLDLAWKDGVLVFQKSTLNDFVKTIERWYGVKVNIIGAPDDEWMISGRFNNETLKNILESLKFARKIDYTLNKDSVTLNF